MLKIFIYLFFILITVPSFANTLTPNKVVMTASSGQGISPTTEDSDITDILGSSVSVGVPMSVQGSLICTLNGNNCPISAGAVSSVTASSPLSSSGGTTPNITLSTSGTWSGNAVTATNATQLNGQSASYYQTASSYLNVINQNLSSSSSPTFITVTADLTGTASGNLVSGGALGTPSSGVATHLTGTASGLTAGSVTTNANLTGDVTSSGNATTLSTVNSNVGSYTNANITVNGKGLITAASNGSSTFVPSNIQVFTSSGTWNKPAACSNAYVRLWGDGGGGKGSGGSPGAGTGSSFAGSVTLTAVGGHSGAYALPNGGTGGTNTGGFSLQGGSGLNSSPYTGGIPAFSLGYSGYGNGGTSTGTAGAGAGEYTEAMDAVTGNVAVTIGTGGAAGTGATAGNPGFAIIEC